MAETKKTRPQGAKSSTEQASPKKQPSGRHTAVPKVAAAAVKVKTAKAAVPKVAAAAVKVKTAKAAVPKVAAAAVKVKTAKAAKASAADPTAPSPAAIAAATALAAPPAAVSRINGRILDARPDRLDFRDLPYRPPLRSLPPLWPTDAAIKQFLPGYIKAKLVRNQGNEGACTGFGMACVANYLRWVRHVETKSKAAFESVSPRMFYELARRYDEWPGVDYEGSSCRGALKGWNKHGVCSETKWSYVLDKDGMPVFMPPAEKWENDAATRPLGVYYRVAKDSVVDLQAALHDIGAVYVSADVHRGWDKVMGAKAGALPTSHAALPTIVDPKDRSATGGHAFALVGYNDIGFIVQNSWGELWGARGFAILPYADWVEHGTDAWVCALGVPVAVTEERIALSRFHVSAGQALGTQARTSRNPHNPGDDPWPVDHPYDLVAHEPWSTAAAYGHTLVSGNDGTLIPSDIRFGTGINPEPYATQLVVDAPRQWFAQQPAGATARLMIYAHGGLNDEDESIRRIRVLAPYAAANGIYPLFLTWKTGPVETLVDIFTDHFSSRVDIGPAGGLSDAVREGADRLIEATSHLILRGVWTEMRENATASTIGGRAIDLLAKKLIELRDALGNVHRPLEIHLVGHSAGSILLGGLLERMARSDLLPDSPKVTSCSLYAAACSVQFAVGTYGKVAQAGLFDLDDLWLSYLTDDNEKADALPSSALEIYGKSLLYLVSRALDDARKMPLLGMEKAITPGMFDPGDWAGDQHAAIKAWQQLWSPGGAIPHGVPVSTPDVRVTKTGKTIPAAHGSFDNNIEVLTATLERIKGAALTGPIEWLDY
ncbi:MAG: C1 family peptidase [Betaproteobacteria bacterium]